MACYIFGAGSFYGLDRRPRTGDFIIAADGGWLACRKTGITPDLLLGDFDSLSKMCIRDSITALPPPAYQPDRLSGPLLHKG